ncbi:JAB-like toxin 1 domain-containing protein [Flavobacterium sp. N2469]
MLSQSFMNELWNKSGDGETKWTNNNGTFSADNGATVNAKDDDDAYTVDKNGNVNRVDEKKYKDKNGKEVDRLIALDDKGKRTSTTMDVDAGTINGGTGGEKGTSKFGSYRYYFRKNNANIKQLFNFLAYNTNVEWSIVASSQEAYIATAQKTDIEFGGISLLNGFLEENGTIKYTYTHSHPNGYSLTPSGYDGKDNSHGGNDMKVKAYFNRWYPGRVTNYIYHMGKIVKF